MPSIGTEQSLGSGLGASTSSQGSEHDDLSSDCTGGRLATPARQSTDSNVGRVVLMSQLIGDKNKWLPALVVLPGCAVDDSKGKDVLHLKSFVDGKVFQLPLKDTKEYTNDSANKCDVDETTKLAFERAVQYYTSTTLPPLWKKKDLLPIADSDTETCESDIEAEEEDEVADPATAASATGRRPQLAAYSENCFQHPYDSGFGGATVVYVQLVRDPTTETCVQRYVGASIKSPDQRLQSAASSKQPNRGGRQRKLAIVSGGGAIVGSRSSRPSAQQQKPLTAWPLPNSSDIVMTADQPAATSEGSGPAVETGNRCTALVRGIRNEDSSLATPVASPVLLTKKTHKRREGGPRIRAETRPGAQTLVSRPGSLSENGHIRQSETSAVGTKSAKGNRSVKFKSTENPDVMAAKDGLRDDNQTSKKSLYEDECQRSSLSTVDAAAAVSSADNTPELSISPSIGGATPRSSVSVIDSDILQSRQETSKEQRTVRARQKRHNGERPYRCTQCDKQFTALSSLAAHMPTHSGEWPYRCTHCDKGFSFSSVLATHLRTHSGLRPYTCSQCGKKFRRAHHLSAHLTTHTGERPYVCTQCGKSFTAACSLAAHKRVHTRERPYACTLCAKAFSLSFNLVSHMRTHTGERPYKCVQCGEGFTRHSTLERHIRTHTGARPYKCTQCGKEFSQRSNLARHMRTHTDTKRMQQISDRSV